jgi:hypothetical protein
MRRTYLWLFVAFVLILAACSGAEASDETTTTTQPTTTIPPTTITTTAPTTTTTTTEPAGPVSPLNGLPVDDPELLDRGVLAVKIDNHVRARPQSGLQEADAVYELLVEGVTRFIALFHDNDSDYLGPIRSVRPTDPTLVNPLDATFAISGGSGWILRRVTSQGTQLLGEGPGMFRIGSRSAPHNLYGNTLELREAALARSYRNEPPPNLFSWGDLEGEEPATNVRLDWGNGLIVTWEWDGNSYLRSTGSTPHNWMTVDGEEGPLTFDTLIVLFARPYTARPPDPSQGTSVPAMETVGTGRALVFAGGEVTEGTWSRSDADDVFELTGADGDSLLVPPGVPWISVFPDTRTVSW